MKSPSLMDFATTLRAFFTQYLPLTRGLSPRTISNYRDSFVLSPLNELHLVAGKGWR